jgi:hypothetical protein
MLHYGVDDHAAAISLLMVLGIATLTAIAAMLVKQTAKEPVHTASPSRDPGTM